MAGEYYNEAGPRTVLDIDCAVSPELLSVKGIDALSALEPCGNGCPKPVVMLENATIDRISLVGNGRHTRLRLRCGRHMLNGIWFSTTPDTAAIEPGDLVDVAFQPQVNEFRGERSAQLNVLDIRPHCNCPCDPDSSLHRRLQSGHLTADEAAKLLPSRQILGAVWRYLADQGDRPIQETPICLCRKVVRRAGLEMDTGMLLTCLDIFSEVGLLQLQRMNKYLQIRLLAVDGKADLQQSSTMQRLLHLKES
jgi:single-stranded-DNA-specific exonuclease